MRSSWILKSAVQGILSVVPYGEAAYRLLQKRAGSTNLTRAWFEYKLEHCRRHLEHYRSFGVERPEGFRALELGTGWDPVVPVGLYLCGASEVVTVDRTPLISPESVRPMLMRFAAAAGDDTLARHLPELRGDRLEQLQVVAARAGLAQLEELGIRQRLCDARRTGLPDRSFDLVVSNNTLEHIPRDVLSGILAEFRRLTHPDGVMSHLVDMKDHYSLRNPPMTPFNFLKFRPAVWRLFNNRLHYQNRLRLPDYRRLFTEAGFEVVAESHVTGTLAELESITLAPEFRSYRAEELLVIMSWFASRPAHA